jgi:crotonobetaine/carnitine-CoA ligase
VNRAVVVGEPAVGTRWARSVEGWDDLVADGRRRDGAPLVTPAATDLFQLLMTSGTTGRPKAVMHSHATRIRSAYRGVLHGRVRDDDVLLNPFPPFHINCLDAALLPALVTGCTAVVLEAFSASAFWGTVRREGATVVSVMPTVVRAVIATPERDDDTDHRVRLVLGALRPTPAELERFLRRFAIPNYETGYGLTEAGMAVTQTVRDLDPHFPSIGIPMFDRTVDLFDAAGRSVPVGAAGEIVVSRAPAGGVMDGYWRDPEATALALAGGWLRTGDLARRDDDGFFYFVGRVKDVIKRSGENIGAEEVEAVLLEHPGVRDVAVIGVPDSYRDEAVMAFLVPEPGGAELTLEAIRGFCHGRIAAFKVPSVISVVSDLPRGVLGKIDKKALRAGVALAAAGQSGDERHV